MNNNAQNSHPTDMPYRVLILDDDIDFNTLLTDIFEQADYAVTSQTNPLEALELFRKNEYDLVVADQKMPDMTGADFMKHCKLIRPQVPVIMVSGYLNNDTIRELISEGVGGVFLKPLNIFSLLERTTSLIQESKKPAVAPAKETGEEPEHETDAKLGFSFRSFPCISSASTSFAQRIYSLRHFRSTLTLIGETGTHFRLICEDIRGFYPGEQEHFIYLEPDMMDPAQLQAQIETAKQQGAGRVTCVLLNLAKMSQADKKLAAALPKADGLFQSIGVPLRLIFCVNTDLDSLFDAGLIDENLYIMMGTSEVQVPPLRDCNADIGIMAQQIAIDFAREKGWPQTPRLIKAVRDFLRGQNWEQNYAELSETVQEIMLASSGDVLTLDLVQQVLQGQVTQSLRARFESYLAGRQADLVRAVALLLSGDRVGVATFFDVEQSAVASKLQ